MLQINIMVNTKKIMDWKNGKIIRFFGSYEIIKNNMKEIIDSIKNIAKERLANPILRFFFLISWLIFIWEFVYTLLFVDQDIIWNSKLLFKK